MRKSNHQRRKLHRLQNLLVFCSKLFFLVGVVSIVLIVYLTWQRSNPWRLSFAIKSGQLARETTSSENNLPLSIQLADANISLPVFPANITKGKWETTTEGVSYLITSALPGQKGNSVFYGHNWPNLLGNLSRVMPGQSIRVILKDGTLVTYEVKFVTIVSPDQTHIIGPSNDKRLTIYTCTGWFDAKRLVVTAIIKS